MGGKGSGSMKPGMPAREGAGRPKGSTNKPKERPKSPPLEPPKVYETPPGGWYIGVKNGKRYTNWPPGTY